MNDSQLHSHRFYRNFSSAHPVDAKSFIRTCPLAFRLTRGDCWNPARSGGRALRRRDTANPEIDKRHGHAPLQATVCVVALAEASATKTSSFIDSRLLSARACS